MAKKPTTPPDADPDMSVASAPHPLPQTGGAFTLVDGKLVAEADAAPQPAPETAPEIDR